MLAGDRLPLVPAHLAWCQAARLPQPSHPIDHRTDPDIEGRCRLTPRHSARLYRRNNTLPQINRIRLAHPCWPPSPASILNQIFGPLGIPIRFSLISSRSRTKVGVTAVETKVGVTA